MTISSTTRKTALATGNGSTTSYAFTFKVQDSDDIVVSMLEDDVETQLTAGFTVTLNTNQNTNPGGSILFDTAPTADQDFIITTDADPTQEQDIQNQSAFNPAIVMEALDKLTILQQQLAEKLNRTMRLRRTATAGDLEIAPEASSYVGFDSNGDLVALTGVLPANVTTSAAGEAFVNLASASSMRAYLTAARAGATNYSALDASINPGLADAASALATEHARIAGLGGGVLNHDYAGTITCTTQCALSGSYVTHRGHRGATLKSTLAGEAFLVGGTSNNQLEIAVQDMNLLGAAGQLFFRTGYLRTFSLINCNGSGLDGLVGMGNASYGAAYRNFIIGGEYATLLPKTTVSNVVGTPVTGSYSGADTVTGPSGFSAKLRSFAGGVATWFNIGATSPAPGETLTCSPSGATFTAGTTTRGSHHFQRAYNIAGGIFMYGVEPIEMGYDAQLDLLRLTGNASTIDQIGLHFNYLGRGRNLVHGEDVRIGNFSSVGNHYDEAMSRTMHLNSTSAASPAVTSKGFAVKSIGDTLGSGTEQSHGFYFGSEDNRAGQDAGACTIVGLRTQGCGGPAIEVYTAGGGLARNFHASDCHGEEHAAAADFIVIADKAAVTGMIDGIQCRWETNTPGSGDLISVGGSASTNLVFGRNLKKINTTGKTINGGPVARPEEFGGEISGSTDGSGDITVTHGMDWTPTNVQVTMTGTTYGVPQVHTRGATTFKVRFFDAAGAAIASTAVTAAWQAFA